MTALITGATSGIGMATAELFAQNGIHLILCGRRQERLDELEKTLGEHTKVYTLNFDVRDRDAVKNAIDSISKDHGKINIEINEHSVPNFITLDISDNGKGVAKPFKKNIFKNSRHNMGRIITHLLPFNKTF